MPRIARQKSEGAIYHVMARSISEVDLFKTDEDKRRYMALIKEYQNIYNFRVYSYCLMDNHLHLILDANGADISKIMHCINFKYARYFNNLHKRHGHLFQDRFKSKIVKDDRYLIALSAYIHNNPTDVYGYEDNPEKYHFSSLSVYLGLRKDPFGVLDEKYILNIFDKDNNKSKLKYKKYVVKVKDISINDVIKEETEFEYEKTEYRSERKILVRNFKTEDVIQFLADKFRIEKLLFHIKYQKEVVHAKAILVLLLRNLCNARYKDICIVLGNITSSAVSKLSSLGAALVNKDERFKNIVKEFIANYC